MSIIDKIVQNIDLEKIKELKDEEYELALVRMICIEMSKYYYRDEIFFLFKENLEERKNIYNNKQSFDYQQVTCKSLCEILEYILSEYFDLNGKITSYFSDQFAHKDVVLTTKNNKKYIINPLMDLVEYKVGHKTTNFASKKMADIYRNKIPDIDYITDEKLLEIDKIIGYVENDKYKNINDLKCDSIEEAIDAILTNKGYLNGIVDLKIFASLKIKKILSENTNIEDIYVDTNDKNSSFTSKLNFCNNNRGRGLIVKDGEYIYLFPYNNGVMKYTLKEWEKAIMDNNIHVNRYAHVDNLNTLKKMNIDRNILHNREFLKVFSYYEKLCLSNEENIMDYIDYSKKYIRVKYECDILFYIEGNQMIKIDYINKTKSNYSFIDEDIVSINSKRFVDFDSKLKKEYMNRTDVLGIFEMIPNDKVVLDYITKYDDKYLSRNYQQYYYFDSEKELLKRRDTLINCLLSSNNLGQDDKYVLLENILNISAKLYYLSCVSNIMKSQPEELNNNYQVFVNDITNFVSFIKDLNIPFNFEEFKETINDFNTQEILHKKKQVELDNKVFILNFAEAITKLLDDMSINSYSILTPGYGSIYIGPFINSLVDTNSSIVLYSQYKKLGISNIDDNSELRNLVVNPEAILNKKIVLLDDNMGTGTTMKRIRKYFEDNNYSVVLSGAYQYTFDRLQEFSIKDRGQELFVPSEQELLTPFNYPRHQILERAVDKLAISPEEYVAYLNLFGYHSNIRSDYETIISDAKFYYNRFTGNNIYDDESLKDSSKKLIKSLL